MKDGFGREVELQGDYYCSFCGCITYHNQKGLCENTDKFKEVQK